jgi:hypothetical protein
LGNAFRFVGGVFPGFDGLSGFLVGGSGLLEESVVLLDGLVRLVYKPLA